jgi:hypothetical protein
MMRDQHMVKKLFFPAVLLCGLFVLGSTGFGAEDTEITIVKFGKLSVRSAVPETKVYVDDTYRGYADSVIDEIIVGEHVISCRTETQSVSGRFSIGKNETLKLEARFNEGKLVAVADREKAEREKAEREKLEKAEAEKKLRVQAAAHKPEKPKKPAAEAKKEEHKNPEEERRAQYLNVVKVFFEDIDAQVVRIRSTVHPAVITKFTEKKDQTGTYFRTKKDQLLCDAGPCEQHWAATFVYTNEQGEGDTFGLNWKQTVYNGITPGGTSKRELLWCLNRECKHLLDAAVESPAQIADLGAYHLTWTRSSLVIRRSDLIQEIVSAGGTLEAY